MQTNHGPEQYSIEAGDQAENKTSLLKDIVIFGGLFAILFGDLSIEVLALCGFMWYAVTKKGWTALHNTMAPYSAVQRYLKISAASLMVILGALTVVGALLLIYWAAQLGFDAARERMTQVINNPTDAESFIRNTSEFFAVFAATVIARVWALRASVFSSGPK